MSDRHTLRMLSLKCHTKKVDLPEVVFIFKYLRNCWNITPDELEFWNISFEEFLRNLICRSFAFALHFELDGLFFNWPGTLRHECFFAQGKSEALNDANLREVSKGSMTARPPGKTSTRRRSLRGGEKCASYSANNNNNNNNNNKSLLASYSLPQVASVSRLKRHSRWTNSCV